ncbi:MAG: V-type ATP synthase subunit D [Planctomycetes bacterium]|nr:V-type ATP synthase subunit D [Planctomycetota bacterium]MCD7896263.1 V-type ATP synthase subunit D [Planctomycetaceae bacterium]
MKIRVNPTRMQLLRLKKRLVMSRRGHKLLKDKMEGLVQAFMELVGEYASLRDEIDREVPRTLSLFMLASGISGEEAVTAALEETDTRLEVEIERKSVMSVGYPEVELKGFELRPSYSTLATTTDFDMASASMRDIFPRLLELASKEEAVVRMADEIEKTRRRVNALEYVMIPSLSSTIKEISAKLEENERSSRARLMKVKDMIM